MVIGFIAGCFDGPFHLGHQYILSEIKDRCDYVVVGINNGEYIRAKKREPISSEEERKNKLYNFGVDEVVVFGDSPIDIVETIQPDYIFVGNDYEIEDVVGYPECEEWGGEVVIIDRISDYSTTKIVENS